MAVFIHYKFFMYIGISMNVTFPILNSKSVKSIELKGGSKATWYSIAHDSEKSREATYIMNEKLMERYWLKIGEGKNELKPTYTYHSEKEDTLLVSLTFPVTISGHIITNVSLSTKGTINSFQWAVSPLRVNCNGKPSTIKYVNVDGGYLIVEWEIEPFFDHEDHQNEVLKMQVQVLPNGYVMFVYKKIPFGSIKNFKSYFDSHITDSFGFFLREKLPDWRDFYLEILILIDDIEVKDGAIIVFRALPFCPNFRTCESCSEAKIEMEDTGEMIPCVWCPEIKRCSSKRDYLLKYWQIYDCENQEISDPRRCPGEEDAEEDAKARKMWSSLRNKPFLLIGIALILATMILETKTYDLIITVKCQKHLLHIKKNADDRSELMQDEYLLDNHKADLRLVYIMDKENKYTRNLINLFYSGKPVEAILIFKKINISEEGGNKSVDSRRDRFIGPLMADAPRINKSEVEGQSNDSDHQAIPDLHQREELYNTSGVKTF